jgi:LPXTG-site transpeptidase (sortase) family protein
MARPSTDQKPNRHALLTLIAAASLLLAHTNIFAESEDGQAEWVQAPQAPIWIQDPWSGESVLTIVREPSTELWNGKRITEYQDAIKVDASPPLGVLTISKLEIQVPIYNGTDEFNLNRGIGRIKGMAKMHEEGHLALSGHRDGFFRGLKDIQVGDDILVQSTYGVERYAVSSITVVPKSDISVLNPTSEKTLTLVTCYPFYFVGNAPERYIVKAVPKPTTL